MEQVQKISLLTFVFSFVLIIYLSSHYPYCFVSHTYQPELKTFHLLDNCDQKIRKIPLDALPTRVNLAPKSLFRIIYFTFLFLSVVKVKQHSQLNVDYSLFFQFIFLIFGFVIMYFNLEWISNLSFLRDTNCSSISISKESALCTYLSITLFLRALSTKPNEFRFEHFKTLLQFIFISLAFAIPIHETLMGYQTLRQIIHGVIYGSFSLYLFSSVYFLLSPIVRLTNKSP